MKILGWELSARKAMRTVDAPFGMVWTPNGFVTQNTDPARLLRDGYNLNSTVYGMIMTMYTKFATIPWILYKVKNNTKASQYKTLTSGYHGKAIPDMLRLKAAAFDEIENEVTELWNKPNDYQTGHQFREHLLLFLKATGAAPIYINKGLSGTKPLSLHSLPSQYIKLWADQSLQTFSKAAYTITGADVDIPLDQFIYWKYPNPNYDITGSHIYGLSPLKAASRVLKADNENMEAQAFTFSNKGATGVFTPKDAATAQNASTQVDTIRNAVDFRANGREYGKARTYINNPMDLHTFGMTAQEMESIAAAVQNKENLANVYNFPPYLIQMAKGTDNKYDDAIKYLVTNTLYPDLTGMRDLLNGIILPMFGYKEGQYFFDFDITCLPELQDDIAILRDTAIQLVGSGILNRNEARDLLKYDKVPNTLMDEFTTNTTVQPLSAAFDVMTDIDLND